MFLCSKACFSDSKESRKGSALLMTLLVVSLLLLVVVAFSIFVRMELKQVIQHQQLLEARSNARLSAVLALSRLQELTGPDQRITLPAWADKGISSSVPPENQNLVGARDAARFQYVNTGGSPSLQTNSQYSAHLGWLVSDGENLDPRSFRPFQVSGSSLLISQDAALMVGAGSVPVANDGNSDGIPDDFVAAPLLNLERNGETKGRFAYWISDEGIKARMNSMDPFRGTSTNSWSLAQAQRSAQEWLIPDFDAEDPVHRGWVERVFSDPQWELANTAVSGNSSPGGTYQHFFHDVTSHSLGMPVNVRRGGLKRDLSAIAEESAAAGGTLSPGTNQGYLDLMDFVTKRRQTQLDESLLLQATLDEDELNELLPTLALPLREEQLTGDGSSHRLNTKHKLFPPSTWMAASRDIGGPTWRQLLSFLTQFERNGSMVAGVPTMEAGLHSERNHNLSPVVSRWHVNVGYTMEEAGSDYLLRMHMMPAISLWNPYNVRLETPEYYIHIVMKVNSGDGIPLWFRIRHPDWHQDSHDGDEGFWAPVYQFAWNQTRPSGEYGNGGFSMLLKVPAMSFEPGEAIWFELGEHHKLDYTNNRDGNAGGFSFPPLPWGSVHDEHGNEFVLRSPGVAELEYNAGVGDDYIDLVPGLSNGGGYSMYLEENFTLRTKIEAGGWRLPRRTAVDTWEPYLDYTDNASWADPNSSKTMQLSPDYDSYWNPYHSRGPRWANNRSNSTIHYPSTFQYRTLDDPSDLKTYSFTELTDGDGNPYFQIERLSGLKVPADRRPDQSAIYNYWLQREDGPYTQRWRNRRRFPVRYNESGIIYASKAVSGESDVDEIPADDLAVELNGITTDWDILEIRTGFVLERKQGYNPTDDQGYSFGNFSRDPKHGDHIHWGKGRFLMASDTAKIDNIRGYRDRTAEFFMAGHIAMFPSAFRKDAIEVDKEPNDQPEASWPMTALNPSSLPMWNASMNAPLAPDFFGGLLHGVVYSVRMPDHGFIAPSDPHLVLDLPWVAHYNPTGTYVGPDALSVTNFRNIGLKGPPSFVGGLSFDPVLLDPANAAYVNDRNAFIGHSGYAEAFTRSGRDWAGAVLRDVPLSFEEFGSIGQLMHANLQSLGHMRGSHSDPWEYNKSWMIAKDGDDAFMGDRAPTYAIGGSLANPDIPDNQTFRVIWSEDQSRPVEDFPSLAPGAWANRFQTGLTQDSYQWGNYRQHYHARPMYDISYWLNDMLWDDFFLSGAANGRLRWQNGIVDRDINMSATRVTQEGSFNVNSTRVAAWAAVLSGFMDLTVSPMDGLTDEALDTDDRLPFSRTSRPFGGGFGSSDGNSSGSTYEGYRRLRPQDIWDQKGTTDPSDDTGLAVEIVEVIKERGPFFSLTEFVNRNPLSSDPMHRKMGALQQAIVQSGINEILDSGDDGSRVVSSDFDMTRMGGANTPQLWGRHWENIHGQLNNSGASASILQQDILAKIGGGIQVRSDTFKIRAHGRVTDPNSGEAVSQAWCEVVVQRRGDYSHPEHPDSGDSDGVDSPDELPHELSELNRRFGRRYEILSFRWLAPHEL